MIIECDRQIIARDGGLKGSVREDFVDSDRKMVLVEPFNPPYQMAVR